MTATRNVVTLLVPEVFSRHKIPWPCSGDGDARQLTKKCVPFEPQLAKMNQKSGTVEIFVIVVQITFSGVARNDGTKKNLSKFCVFFNIQNHCTDRTTLQVAVHQSFFTGSLSTYPNPLHRQIRTIVLSQSTDPFGAFPDLEATGKTLKIDNG